MSVTDDKQEHGYAGVKKNNKVKPLCVISEKPVLIRHRYKCDIGKKSYTFRSKKEMSSSLGLSRTTTNKLLKGELASDKIKIGFI